jgi:hypothetical protein
MPADQITPKIRQRNPVTHEAHRRQAFWQIYFPIILFSIFVIVAIVIAVLAENQKVSKWSDISLIFMISIMLIAFLVTTILLVLIIYYLRQGIKATPFYMFDAQRFTYLLEVRVKLVSNAAVEPILRIKSFIAGARALWRK